MLEIIISLISINKILKGDCARLSKKQLVKTIISIKRARKNLEKEQFNNVYQLYCFYRKDKVKELMDYDEYIYVCEKIAETFNDLAPLHLYDKK